MLSPLGTATSPARIHLEHVYNGHKSAERMSQGARRHGPISMCALTGRGYSWCGFR